MQVRVLYFGVLKDAFGCDGEVLELADGATVADLLRGFRGREVGREGFWDSIAVAVNQEYAKAGDLLKGGDEVALLPPVSGGLGYVASLRPEGECRVLRFAQNDWQQQLQKQIPFGDDKLEKQVQVQGQRQKQGQRQRYEG